MFSPGATSPIVTNCHCVPSFESSSLPLFTLPKCDGAEATVFSIVLRKYAHSHQWPRFQFVQLWTVCPLMNSVATPKLGLILWCHPFLSKLSVLNKNCYWVQDWSWDSDFYQVLMLTALQVYNMTLDNLSGQYKDDLGPKGHSTPFHLWCLESEGNIRR